MSATILPDDAVFSQFRNLCSSADNWYNKYDKNGMQVWVEVAPVVSDAQKNAAKIHMIKCRMTIKDVSAATMYDVIHDGVYRSNWDPTMVESFDVARLSANADFGYYAWACPRPMKRRDVVTLRAWQVTDDDYVIVNFSVKHSKYPPRNDRVRAISIMTGYLIKATGPNSCTFTYLSKADPKGKTLNKMTTCRHCVKCTSKMGCQQSIAKSWLLRTPPQVMKCVHKAGKNYPQWKRENSPDQKPWLFPEQNTLPMMDPAELSLQRADSLENVDESSLVDAAENGD
ncbi:hypothetical protein CRUP_018347 [Coryphaenoides rupestris]|nr:hypothetical protein CRUP_018347 [Coryphaenoides rupestris]